MIMSGRTTDQEDSVNGVSHQEERFLASKVLSKERSRANSSSRVYYYGGATVPFVWETCPGTPKHTLSSESSSHLDPPPPPPLTPPPSYFSSSSSSSGSLSSTPSKHINKVTRTKQTHFLATLFHLRKSNTLKGHHASHPSLSWSSTSSSVSSSSSSYSSTSPVSSSRKVGFHRKKFSLPCSRSPLPYVKDSSNHVAEEEEDEDEELRSSSSPTSTLCYGSNEGKRRFGSSMKSLKRALFSSVRFHGSKGQDFIRQ